MLLKDHLRSRNYEPAFYNGQVLDEENNLLTVYLYSLSGKIVGYQQYNPNVESKKFNSKDDSRYFTYITKGEVGVWGLEKLNPDDRRLFVVEGIFKAAALHKAGFNAIAVLCSNPKHCQSWFKTLPYRLIPIGDNDAAGKKLVNTVNPKWGFTLPKDLDEYETHTLNITIRNHLRHINCKNLPYDFEVKITSPEIIDYLCERNIAFNTRSIMIEMYQITLAQSGDKEQCYFIYPMCWLSHKSPEERGIFGQKILTLDDLKRLSANV